MNVIYWAVPRSAWLVVSRSDLSQPMRSCTGNGAWLWVAPPLWTATGPFLAFSSRKKTHSYRVACVVGQNVSCIDNILPQKIREDVLKRCAFQSSMIVFHNNIKLLLWQPNVAKTKVWYFCKWHSFLFLFC